LRSHPDKAEAQQPTGLDPVALDWKESLAAVHALTALHTRLGPVGLPDGFD
jgi:hypothetical protein